jgi:hypothetical protein
MDWVRIVVDGWGNPIDPGTVRPRCMQTEVKLENLPERNVQKRDEGSPRVQMEIDEPSSTTSMNGKITAVVMQTVHSGGVHRCSDG